jgi:hypothetical protein
MTEAAAPLTQTISASSAWGLDLHPAGCSHCGAVFLLKPGMEGVLCPACAGAALTAQGARLRDEPPELVAPFQTSDAQTEAGLQDWTGGVWLRPPDFTHASLQARLQRIYLPMWLVDAHVDGQWQSGMGFDYQVESAHEAYGNGRWVEQKVTETRVRWEPRAGEIQRDYQNVAVPALESHAHLISGLGNFDLGKAQPYNASSLQITAIRNPDLDTQAAWSVARPLVEKLSAVDCQAASGAQHNEEFKLNAGYKNLNWTQLLLPVYATYYQDESGVNVPVLINGQTGKIYGIRRASQKKGWTWTGVLLAVAFACFLLALLLSFASSSPGTASNILFLAALVFGAVSPYPAAWAWQFNHRNPLPRDEKRA